MNSKKKRIIFRVTILLLIIVGVGYWFLKQLGPHYFTLQGDECFAKLNKSIPGISEVASSCRAEGVNIWPGEFDIWYEVTIPENAFLALIESSEMSLISNSGATGEGLLMQAPDWFTSPAPSQDWYAKGERSFFWHDPISAKCFVYQSSTGLK